MLALGRATPCLKNSELIRGSLSLTSSLFFQPGFSPEPPFIWLLLPFVRLARPLGLRLAVMPLQLFVPAGRGLILTHLNAQRLDADVALNAFLLEVQTGAFRMAVLATRSEAEALDLVQDAMLRWVKRYRDKPQTEWKPLFFRVLQNRIRDWQRRSILGSRIFLSTQAPQDDESTEDAATMEYAGPESDTPDSKAANGEFSKALIGALRELPKRQREAFVLRTWQGLSTRETAAAMGCGEGSVMTHLSRAHQALRCHLSAWGG